MQSLGCIISYILPVNEEKPIVYGSGILSDYDENYS